MSDQQTSIKTNNGDIDKIRQKIATLDPITSEDAKSIRTKIMNIYSRIKYNAIYVSNPDLFLEIDQNDDDDNPIKIEHFQASLIVAYIMNRCSTLIFGSPGAGKTATIRAVSRMMTGSSIIDMRNIVHCDFEITKEDWLGNKDPKRILEHSGGWILDWADWVTDPNIFDLIIDEGNRGSDNFQNQILELLADGRVQYGIKFRYILPEIRIFMTYNPRDETMGTMNVRPLQYALKDRFTQSIRVPRAGRYAEERFSVCRQDDRSLGYSDDEMIKPELTPQELRTATLFAEKIPVDHDAHLLAIYLCNEAGICIRAPMYDKTFLTEYRPDNSDICDNCHFSTQTDQICRKFYGGSMRMYKDLIALGKAYAFLLAIPSVTKHIIHAIAPDVISHRITVSEQDLRKDVRNTGGDSYEYIKKNYIPWCWGRLQLRKEVEEAYQNLLKGNGNMDDLKRIINFAQNDLAVRIEMLPIISVGDGIKDNLMTYNSLTNCANTEYKQTMKKVIEAMESGKISDLDIINNNLPNIPLKPLIQDQIYAAWHKINRSQQIQKPK